MYYNSFSLERESEGGKVVVGSRGRDDVGHSYVDQLLFEKASNCLVKIQMIRNNNL